MCQPQIYRQDEDPEDERQPKKPRRTWLVFVVVNVALLGVETPLAYLWRSDPVALFFLAAIAIMVDLWLIDRVIKDFGSSG